LAWSGPGLAWLCLAWLEWGLLGLAWGLAWLGLSWVGLAWFGLVSFGLAWLGNGRSAAALVLVVVDEGVSVLLLVLSLWVRGVDLVLGGGVGVEVERGRDVVGGVGVGRRRIV
jgi:hypothetical protein